MIKVIGFGSKSNQENSTTTPDSNPALEIMASMASLARCSFGYAMGKNRWTCSSVCKCMITTDLITEKGNPVSVDSTTFRGSKEDDLVLKPSPKPVLKAQPKIIPFVNTNSKNSVAWTPTKIDGETVIGKTEDVEERKKVIESLGEVLEKAEKLESAASRTPPSANGSGKVGNRPGASTRPNARMTRTVNSSPTQKSKTLKSVWRKGNPVASVQTVVKEPPKVLKTEKEDVDKAQVEKVDALPRAPLRPLQSPPTVQPTLQARPAVAPPPPAIKKPVILKDVGASPRPPVTVDAGSGVKSKQRGPILIDKFASKKPVVDPIIAQAVIPPPKPVKNPAFSKFKDESRKKGGAPGGLRRRSSNASEPDDDSSFPKARKGRKWSKASRKAARLQAAKDAAPVKVEILEVDEEGMLTEDLAYNLAISEGEILGYLYSKGIKPDGVQTLDRDMVKMVCKEYEVEVIDAVSVAVEEMAKKKEIFDEEDLDKLEPRPPVLTIMGHVDHGKTTLLDYIRKSKVTASEAGGITQGIGAYKVLVPVDGKLQPCVFLDTPGHEAFGAMRARGARVTDIAIIVVAADDGVRPQTNEAIAHAKAAGVPIVMAINKIDKDGASPERVMQELSSIGLMPEDWGGDVPMVQISALKGENVGDLLETVMLVAELQELKANPHRNAKGTIIEAGLDKSKGPISTFIVQKGTLKRGDIVVCGGAFGKVRALFDDTGNRVNEAGPSSAVQVIGLNNVPVAGDEFEVVDSLDIAREKAELRAESLRDERISAKAGDGKVTLSSLASAVSAGKQAGIDLHQLNIVMKVDLQGSIEAIRQALHVLPQDNVTLKFLLQATGDVSTSDVDLAVASQAIIVGFNVKAPGAVKTYADQKGVEIRLYRVIYELIDDVRNAMEGLLDPVEEQIPIGSAEVRAVFSSGSGRVAGCMVTEGKVVKGCRIRVIRKGKTVYSGVLDSLRRVKEMVKEVNAGLECGMGMDDFLDWEVGDTLEAYTTVQKQRTLEEASSSMAEALAGAGFER
ncbi:Translation initiation factor if-2 protein [Thalictrum thalictroides]|uniref:Translation initiation factor IF-2, chloroplastic n=1 Tax=Thalictrum thalictroides TaxID=46969 RepID=A0A7J6VXQ6_THATH|nr:Translation initiation factor if-2 protein [Thalictrum thalictroides]